MKNIAFIVFLFSLTGCATYKPLYPTDYQGATAIVADTFERKGTGSANFYYLKSYNGNSAINAINTTNAASQGKGSVIHPRGAKRTLPTTEAKFNLAGQVHHSAPIGYLFNANSNYLIEGDITLTPEPSKVYLVKGYLSETYSAVWIEDIDGNIISDIIENLDAESPNALAHKETVLARKAKKNSQSEIAIFSNISGGEPADIVLMKLGAPDRITETESNFFLSRPAKTIYHYDKLGTISFISGNTMYVESISPKALSTNIDSNRLRFQLDNYDAAMLQNFAKEFFSSDITDTASLDIVAEKIWVNREAEDDREIDALSWFCKSLAKSSNARYSQLLSKLANDAKSDKLKRYARLSLESLPDEEAEQFEIK